MLSGPQLEGPSAGLVWCLSCSYSQKMAGFGHPKWQLGLIVQDGDRFGHPKWLHSLVWSFSRDR